MKVSLLRLVGLVLALCLSGAAAAHELRPAFLEIREEVGNLYDVLWKTPARGEFRLSLDVVFPKECEDASPVTNKQTGSAIVSRWRIRCVDGLDGRTIGIGGLSATYTDALFRLTRRDGTVQTSRLTPEGPEVIVASSPSVFDTARTYFLLGMEHILEGVDHLLFVLALLLLIPSIRMLVGTVTAFTVAHSITLAFAAFGWSSAPQPPVEALIALSIVIVAAEIINRERGRRDISIRYPWLIAFAFGLLHGFGFGGALREIGLPQKDVPMALLSFNLGVEAGQLLFIFVVLITIALIRKLVILHSRLPQLIAAYGIGSVAAFWFVERIATF